MSWEVFISCKHKDKYENSQWCEKQKKSINVEEECNDCPYWEEYKIEETPEFWEAYDRLLSYEERMDKLKNYSDEELFNELERRKSE